MNTSNVSMPPTMNTRSELKTRSSWHVAASDMATNTFNPIRNIVETMKPIPNPAKKTISLSIGDPTICGNLKPPEVAIEAMQNVLTKSQHCSYTASTGHKDAKSSVAEFCSVTGATLTHEDIVLCSGCSHSLDLCISVLANPGQNILIPKPGFPLYKTLAEGFGISCKYYNLLPERNWEIDLDHLESLIDFNTAAIVINNPSNPCGSVFSKNHLQDIVKVAERNYVPIISDEIYDYFVFSGNTFYPLASLSANVPILTCGGLTKRFMVPGWRMGWILIHDRNDVLKEVRKGLHNLSQRIIGSNVIVQSALPDILQKTPQDFYDRSIQIVEKNAEISFNLLSKVAGLHPIMPQGAMYMMIAIDMAKFPDIKDDLDFCKRLFSEESVFPLPGRCFDYPNYIRIILTVPSDLMTEACERITSFCTNHYREFTKTSSSSSFKDKTLTTTLVNGNGCVHNNADT